MMHLLNNTTRRLEPLVNKTLLRLRPKNIHVFIALLLGLWARVGQANRCTHGNSPARCNQMINKGTRELRGETCSYVYKMGYGNHLQHACEDCGYCTKACPETTRDEFCNCIDICIGDKVLVLKHLTYGDWKNPDHTFTAKIKEVQGTACIVTDRDGQTYKVHGDQIRVLPKQYDNAPSHSDQGRQSRQPAQRESTGSTPRSRDVCPHDFTFSERFELRHDCADYDRRRQQKQSNGSGYEARPCTCGDCTECFDRDPTLGECEAVTPDFSPPTNGSGSWWRRNLLPTADKLHRRQLAALKARTSQKARRRMAGCGDRKCAQRHYDGPGGGSCKRCISDITRRDTKRIYNYAKKADLLDELLETPPKLRPIRPVSKPVKLSKN
jgi:hypothetical protein